MEQAVKQQEQTMDNKELIYPFPVKTASAQVNTFIYLIYFLITP